LRRGLIVDQVDSMDWHRLILRHALYTSYSRHTSHTRTLLNPLAPSTLTLFKCRSQ